MDHLCLYVLADILLARQLEPGCITKTSSRQFTTTQNASTFVYGFISRQLWSSEVRSLRSEIAAFGESGGIEVKDYRPLLQGIAQREIEFLPRLSGPSRKGRRGLANSERSRSRQTHQRGKGEPEKDLRIRQTDRYIIPG